MDIPKIIHYCWFGKNEYPKNIKKYIEGWKYKLPDYKFILWNEENFDINSILFVKQAYEMKKYAFVSDYVRLYALYKYGGIYLDTDMEIIKNFDKLLDSEIVLGQEEPNGGIATCFIATIPKHKLIKSMMEYYKDRSFYMKKGKLDIRPNNLILLEILTGMYGVNLCGKEICIDDEIHIYPFDYFQPKSLVSGKIRISRDTYAIHWHTLSWVSWKVRLVKFIRIKIFIPLFGENAYNFIEKFRKR